MVPRARLASTGFLAGNDPAEDLIVEHCQSEDVSPAAFVDLKTAAEREVEVAGAELVAVGRKVVGELEEAA